MRHGSELTKLTLSARELSYLQSSCMQGRYHSKTQKIPFHRHMSTITLKASFFSFFHA